MRRLLLALLAATPLYAQLEEPIVVKAEAKTVRRNIAYDGERKLDLYRPNDKETLPLVIFLNGVGRPDLKDWGQYTSWPPLIASRGMAAIAYETSGTDVLPQTEALLAYVRKNAAELKIDPSRIAIWACSANSRMGTALVNAHEDLRAAVFYYGLMEQAPKNATTPVYVARAGLDALTLNASIDRWVAQAVALDAPVTLVTYPEGLHGFDIENDTPESKRIILDTVEFLRHHLTTAPTPRREPITLATLQRLIAEEGVAKGVARLSEIAKTHPNAYVLQERTLNGLGYAFLAERKVAEAVAILEHVVKTRPESANAHDSLADAYEAADRKAEAIAASERALQLVDKVSPQQREGIRRSAEERLKRLR
ncbi:MAG TPA: dienelactone hydrolase family protein [Thermoanaerobaculia bacterium]|nr:dienelactone hydrolase family protein [Thermoanaerobaculia bacterium]